MTDSSRLRFRIVPRLSELSREAWDALVPEEATPFLRYDWLETLESTGCVEPSVGWMAQHLTMWEDDRLVGAVPLYVKGTYEGEFVFDHAWADLSERIGEPWYPKLIAAVPFTPATGSRFLTSPHHDIATRTRLSAALSAAARDFSGIHVLFCAEPEADQLEALGWIRRSGVQFHWENKGFTSWDDFLGSFNTKRRHQIRRERRTLLEAGVKVETRAGKEIDEQTLETFLRCYLNTVEKFYPWTRQYLTRAFFEQVIERMGDAIEIVVATQGGRPLASAFNVASADRLFGRYWGSLEEVPFLHFEVCYYHSIERCIALKKQAFEPGAGGSHKRPRGFSPTWTWSCHELRSPRVAEYARRYVRAERAQIEARLMGGEEP